MIKDYTAEWYQKNHILSDPYKKHPSDTIWWFSDLNCRGTKLFSFDGKKLYNFWPDYPDKLTPEQKAIFDKENPELASLKDDNIKGD